MSYFVFTKTGTILSRLIHLFTEGSYTHSSFSINNDLQDLRSFGRIWQWNPIIGGYVKEDIKSGILSRNANKVLVVKIKSDKEDDLRQLLSYMDSNRHEYSYDYKAILLGSFGLSSKDRSKFYCSKFCYECLKTLGYEHKFTGIITPSDLAAVSLQFGDIVYEGTVGDLKKLI